MTASGMTLGDGSAARTACSKMGWLLRASCLATLAAACVSSGDSRGTALYPQSGGAPLAREQLATLSGHVAEVDGVDVTSLVPPYELLPGCHVVRTPERWGAVGTDMSMAAQTGMLPFALTMRAGHSYMVEVRTQMQTTIAGSLEIRAVESNATGEQTSVFAVERDPAVLDRCARSQSAGG